MEPPAAAWGLLSVTGTEVRAGRREPCVLSLGRRSGRYGIVIHSQEKGNSDPDYIPINSRFKCVQEAEETLLIDIATNSKFYNCSRAAKAPFRKQAACWALTHAYFTYYFIILLHALRLSFDQAGTVFPLMLLSGSFSQS